MNSGVVFRWLPSNQKEIKNHRMNNGRTPNLQAFVNKMHLDYIATRPGAALNDKIKESKAVCNLYSFSS